MVRKKNIVARPSRTASAQVVRKRAQTPPASARSSSKAARTASRKSKTDTAAAGGRDASGHDRPAHRRDEPAAKPFVGALIAELAAVGADMPELRAIARKAIDQALAGEKEARSFIADRLDGKSTATAAQSGEGPVTVVIRRFAKD